MNISKTTYKNYPNPILWAQGFKSVTIDTAQAKLPASLVLKRGMFCSFREDGSGDQYLVLYKSGKVYEAVSGGTTVKLYKDHSFGVGDTIYDGSTAVTISTITTTNASYDSVVVSSAVTFTLNEVIYNIEDPTFSEIGEPVHIIAEQVDFKDTDTYVNVAIAVFAALDVYKLPNYWNGITNPLNSPYSTLQVVPVTASSISSLEFNLIAATETTIATFATNSANYTFKIGDFIQLTAKTNGSVGIYVYKGGTKTTSTNYVLIQENVVLLDSSAVAAVDYENRKLINSLGNDSVLWEAYTLQYNGVNALNWDSRRMYNAAGTIVHFQWDTLVMKDSSNVSSFDGENRTLKDAAGATSLDWSNADGIKVTLHTDDVSNPPTDAELDAIFGTPATVGGGFVALIDDNGANTNEYLVWSDGTKWFYVAGTAAV